MTTLVCPDGNKNVAAGRRDASRLSEKLVAEKGQEGASVFMANNAHSAVTQTIHNGEYLVGRLLELDRLKLPEAVEERNRLANNFKRLALLLEVR